MCIRDRDIVKFQAVDLGDQLAVGMLLGKQGQQDIFLVDVGQGYKGLGGGQALGEQELAVGAVLAQDLCLGQGLGLSLIHIWC